MNRTYYIVFWLCCLSFLSFSQPYGNEWVDHSKSYHKLKLINEGMYRIPYSTLINFYGESELLGADFQLFSRGEELAIYVTTEGQFADGDYIEFYGRRNDGELDTELYKPDKNLNPYYSLYNITATYFLTLNPGGNNFRLEPQINDPTGLSIEPYFWHRSLEIFVNEYYNGPPIAGGTLQVLRDSHYGSGEGWTGTAFNGPTTRNRILGTPNVYRGDGNLQASLHHTHVTRSFLSAHQITLSVGSSSANYTVLSSDVNHVITEIPLGNILDNGTTVSFRENGNASVADAHAAITYPRTFNFSNTSTFRFEVENTNAVQLQISDFNNEGFIPVLYDLANGQRYEAIINGSRFDIGMLPAAQTRDLVLASQNASSYTFITELESVNLVDYTDLDNQANNIILSNRILQSSSDSIDYINAYNDYRNSPQGGGHISRIAWIIDIEDQFGWGVRNHPMAIRNFINYAVDNFNSHPDHFFIIGKGITYTSIRGNATNFNNCLVPSMGEPDSDAFLAARSASDEVPQVAIGRLAAANGDMVGQYLDKMMMYEGEQFDTIPFSQTVQNKQWNKRLLHLGGGKNAIEQAQFKLFLNNYKKIAEDHFYGGKVHSVFKTSTDPIQISTSELVDSLINNGISLITFFGHSSTSTIDFDISPEEFENNGKFHVFLNNGCFVGSIFGTSATNYSNRFIFQDNTGSIAYIAPITLAVPSSLNLYSTSFYRQFSPDRYRESLGKVMQETATELINTYSVMEDLLAKQMILHGDPALRINAQARPDYIITRPSISYDPEIVSASRDSFDIVIAITNVGKAVDREYTVGVQRILPNGGLEDYLVTTHAAHFQDTVRITMPTDRVNGLGVNIMRIKVEFGEEIDETSEYNNEVVDTLIIFSDDIKPILPYEFCIQNSDPNPIFFSTASIADHPIDYILQIDTTEYFNSPIRQEEHVSTRGGIVEWSPSIPYMENTVYYVRSALDSVIMGDYNWNNSSFLYNTSLSTGWNQSHFFQFKKDDFFTMQLNEPDRQFRFSDEVRTLGLINGMAPSPVPVTQQYSYLDGNQLLRGSLSRASLNFFVFDIHTGKFLESFVEPDHPILPNIMGTYNDIHGSDFPAPRPILNYLVNDWFWRFQVYLLIETHIPEDAIVMVFFDSTNG